MLQHHDHRHGHYNPRQRDVTAFFSAFHWTLRRIDQDNEIILHIHPW
jgi:hypothetical protein